MIRITKRDTFHHNFTFLIDLDSEEMIKSKKYEYRLTVTAGLTQILSSAFCYVNLKKIEETLACLTINLKPGLSETGSLSISAHLEIKHHSDPVFRQKRHSTPNLERKLLDLYSNLLNDSSFSDFTFIVKGKNFKVHKNILASVSETMRAMFTSDLKESVLGECIVDDIEPHIFQHMLKFIYAATIPVDLDNVAVDLYKAAHYYRIVELMEICKDSIHFLLSDCNAPEIFKFSTLYDIKDIQTDAWKIIKL